MLDNYHKWDQVFFRHIFLLCVPPSFVCRPLTQNRKEKVGFSQVAACAYICEMTHGYENEVNSSQSTFSVHLVSDSFTFLPEVPRPHPLHAWQWSTGTVSTGLTNIAYTHRACTILALAQANSSTVGWSLQRRWLRCCDKCEDYGRHRRGLVRLL